MRSSSSDFAARPPAIPDHEMIRQIGKGSYGEVWLGRGVTGALRAIKVVSRADFEYDRTFEREFDGIKSFEPISRTHPGVVDILHVGRNLTEGFYYYVMELADDRLSGREIVPELYVPRTLSSDIKEKGQLPVDACADWGALIADALHHMHASGLAHRDVKPSNIIFVDGVPKLADIGLVAMSGQRTFVGTEGFVPPEGPGEPGADIYSLGMVLYETSTGMDRLDFPAVPQLTGDEVEKKKWRRLNSVVCKACAPSPRQRYSNAREMRHALLSLKARSREPASAPAKLLCVALFSGLLGAAIVGARNQDLFAAYSSGNQIAWSDLAPLTPPEPTPEVTGDGGAGNPPIPVPPIPVPPERIDVPIGSPDPPLAVFGSVKIPTKPGARVYRVVDGGEKVFVGEARPDYFDSEVEPGEVAYEIVLDGYRTLPLRGFVEAGEMLLLDGEMEFFRPPLPGKPWENSRAMEFQSVGDRHASSAPIPVEMFMEFLAAREGEDQVDYDLVTVTLDHDGGRLEYGTVKVGWPTAREFFGWLTGDEVVRGYLSENHYYSLDPTVICEVDVTKAGRGYGFAERFPLFPVVEKENYASLVVDSQPRGAGIYIDGDYRGTTSVEVPGLRPGPMEVTVRLAGYRQQVQKLQLEPGKTHRVSVALVESDGVVFGEPWKNGLGMELLPLGDGVMLGAEEVRVRDYDEYCEAKKIDSVHRPPFVQGGDHPVVKVSRDDAIAFCEWLTERERGEGLIDPGHTYRLPTDREWSRAANLDQETGEDPASRDGQVRGLYPWGNKWPPPDDVANLADASARSWLDTAQIMAGYDDGYANTAPVGSFEPNALGFYDLAGNVWEWVADAYGGTRSTFKDYAVARGGGYDSSTEDHFLSSYRNLQPADTRDTIFGFRVALAERGRELN